MFVGETYSWVPTSWEEANVGGVVIRESFKF